MSILSRYIARQYLTNIVILFVLLCSFVVMVDLSVNLTRFTRAGAKLAELGAPDGSRAAGGISIWHTLVAIADLWWPRLLQLYNYVLGLVLVGAMGFTFTQLSRNRELVAMLAGGFSLYRAARPVLFVATFCVTLQVANQEFVLPRLASLLTRDPGQAGSAESSTFPVKLTPDSVGTLFQAKEFDPSTNQMTGVNIWLRENGRAGLRITADSARWDNAAWVLQNPRVVPLTLAPKSAAPTVPSRITTDLDPTTILVGRYASYSASLSWRQIGRVLAAPSVKPDVRERLVRIGWGRVSGIICSLLSLVITLPFYLTREPENMILQSLKCAPVAVVTLLGGLLGASVAIPGLPPVVSVFIPVLILAPLAVAAVSSIRT